MVFLLLIHEIHTVTYLWRTSKTWLEYQKRLKLSLLYPLYICLPLRSILDENISLLNKIIEIINLQNAEMAPSTLSTLSPLWIQSVIKNVHFIQKQLMCFDMDSLV